MPGTDSCSQLVWLLCIWKDSSACTLCDVCALDEERNPTAASLFEQATPWVPCEVFAQTIHLPAASQSCCVHCASAVKGFGIA